MKVTIWDLDYYYSEKKVNCFNPDVMRLSSYHKQKGDEVNFVLSSEDIFRPYDLYYIVKENKKTPNPPLQFYTDSRVKWWGKAVKQRVNWKMNAAMIACRPDYLLYPEKDTKMERSDQIRLFDDTGKFVERRQEWSNAYTSKHTLIVDENLMANDLGELRKALEWLQTIQNVSFLHEISLVPLMVDLRLSNLFLKLKLHKGSVIKWAPVVKVYAYGALEWLINFYKKQPLVKKEPLRIQLYWGDHWAAKTSALIDFQTVRSLIVWGKKNEIIVSVQEFDHRLDTPYFLFFEEVIKWMNTSPRSSWLEWLTRRYGGSNIPMEEYWNNAHRWSEVFRDLLRQTYFDTEFLLLQWNKKRLSENKIPWMMWHNQFKYGL